MAGKKKNTKTDKRIEKKRQKLQKQSVDTGLPEGYSGYGSSAPQASSGKQTGPARQGSSAASSAKTGKNRKSSGQRKKNGAQTRDQGNNRPQNAPRNNRNAAVRNTGLDERYAYGSFAFDEYGREAFRDDGYLYKPQNDAQEAPKEASKSISDRKIDKKRERRRLEADTSRITPRNRRRLVLGFALILLMMAALIFRMGYWQIVRADELRTMAAQMQKVDTEIDPVRGSIYDSKMNVLAEPVTEYELYGYSQYLYKSVEITQVEKDNTVRQLVSITGLDAETIKAKLSDPDENLVLLAGGLTSDQVERAQKVFDSKVVVKTRVARYYPNGAFAAQLLGGVNADNVGRSGLEYEYNSVLAGVKGRTVRTTDRDGNTVAGSKTKYYEPKDGDSIVTTIDSVIQNFVETALEKGMKKTGARQITCIVMNPKTGDILALASTPEYDPNHSSEPSSAKEKESFAKMTSEEQTEYLSRMWTIDAVSNIYEPGSTFKLIAAAAAIDSGSSTKDSRYQCNGYIHVGGYNLRCLGVHGKQSLKDAVGNSCNPGMAKVALDMGADTFYNYIDLFGFNDKTGVDLPGETSSIVKDPNGMGDVDLATTGYGQGIAVTPLQILCAVNSLGNNGVLMKPKVVKKIIDKDGNTVKDVEDTPVRQVVSKETAAEMCDIMEYYVQGYSGNQAYVPGYRVGGKTGTANLVENSRYAKDVTNASFVAMAPMDDPQLSMIVIVYRPTKQSFGNWTSGPIIKEVMEKSLQYMGVEREYTKSEAKEVKKNKVKVPKVTGMNSKEAIRLLKLYNLNYQIEPEPAEGNENQEFLVVDQNPKKGTRVEKGSVVYIYSE